jgi:hypothetical protein
LKIVVCRLKDPKDGCYNRPSAICNSTEAIMPLAKLNCPKCHATLKPAKPVPEGKMVKCPKCEEMFKAGGEAVEEPAAKAARSEAVKKPAAAATAAAGGDDEEAATYGVVKDEAEEKRKQEAEERERRRRKRRRKQKAGEQVDDEEEEEEEGGNDMVTELLRNLKSKDPRGPAQETIVSPGNWILRTALIGFFGWVIYFIVFMIPVCFPHLEEDGSVTPAAAEDKTKKQPKFKLTDEAWAEMTKLLSADSLSKLERLRGKEFNSYDEFLRKCSENVLSDDIAKVKKATRKFTEKRDKYRHWWSAETILDEDNTPWSVMAFIFVLLVGLAQSGVIAISSVKMQSLESFQWSVAGAITALIPLTTFPVFVLITSVFDLIDYGLDFGWEGITWMYALPAFLWGPVVGGLTLKALFEKHVRPGFEYRPD